MLHAIVFFDSPLGVALRPALRERHVDYITEHLHLILASGGVYDEDDRPCGGLIILDTEDRAVAEDFLKRDPFYEAGVYGEHKILRWRKGFYNKERLC